VTTSDIDRDVAIYVTLAEMAAALGMKHPAPKPPTPMSASAWEQMMMQALGTVKQGDTGQSVRDVQGLCVAHGYGIAVDGDFGPTTDAAVKDAQIRAKITADGIVGPQTWPVLPDVA